MNLDSEEIFNKKYFIIACEDFIYYPKVVEVIGIEATAFNDEPRFIINQKDIFGEDDGKYLEELTRFKTLLECEKECERLNNIPENKKQAMDWALKGKYICKRIEAQIDLERRWL